MTIYCEKGHTIHTCGLEVVGNFASEEEWDRDILLEDLQFGHTGFFVAGFIEGSTICDKVYAYLKDKYKTVYQSPVRRNENSGNMFFFVIYDAKE